jgi:hypothetical protein
MEWVVMQSRRSQASLAAHGICTRPGRGTDMHSVVGRLIQWVAEILDRSLYTVPDLDQKHVASDTNSSDF